MSFVKNEALKVEGTSIPKLAPAIYTGLITSIEKSEKAVYQSTEKQAVLNITFKDSVSGKDHTEQLSAPKATEKTTIDEANQYAFENLLHIANGVLTPEEIKVFEDKAAKAKNYDALIDIFILVMTPKLNTVQLNFKLNGSAASIDGKTVPVVKFNNFNSRGLKQNIQPVPYIAKIDGSVTLKFSTKEREANDAYFKLVNSSSGDVNVAPASKTNPADLFA